MDTTAGILLKPVKKDIIDDFGFLKGHWESADLKTIRKTVRNKMAGRIR